MTGSEPTSSQAVEYSVSKLNRVTSLKSAAGNSRVCVKAPIGPRPICLPGPTLVACRRLISIKTSGYKKMYASTPIWWAAA